MIWYNYKLKENIEVDSIGIEGIHFTKEYKSFTSEQKQLDRYKDFLDFEIFDGNIKKDVVGEEEMHSIKNPKTIKQPKIEPYNIKETYQKKVKNRKQIYFF
jgi:hypothetical protein